MYLIIFTAVSSCIILLFLVDYFSSDKSNFEMSEVAGALITDLIVTSVIFLIMFVFIKLSKKSSATNSEDNKTIVAEEASMQKDTKSRKSSKGVAECPNCFEDLKLTAKQKEGDVITICPICKENFNAKTGERIMKPLPSKVAIPFYIIFSPLTFFVTSTNKEWDRETKNTMQFLSCFWPLWPIGLIYMFSKTKWPRNLKLYTLACVIAIIVIPLLCGATVGLMEVLGKKGTEEEFFDVAAYNLSNYNGFVDAYSQDNIVLARQKLDEAIKVQPNSYTLQRNDCRLLRREGRVNESFTKCYLLYDKHQKDPLLIDLLMQDAFFIGNCKTALNYADQLDRLDYTKYEDKKTLDNNINYIRESCKE